MLTFTSFVAGRFSPLSSSFAKRHVQVRYPLHPEAHTTRAQGCSLTDAANLAHPDKHHVTEPRFASIQASRTASASTSTDSSIGTPAASSDNTALQSWTRMNFRSAPSFHVGDFLGRIGGLPLACRFYATRSLKRVCTMAP